MPIADFHFWAPTLGKQIGLAAILPEKGKGPFPVLYLLHGLGDDYTIWQRRTRIEMYVSEAPLIVVMPDGLRGFYTDHEAGPAFGAYLTDDVLGFVDRFLPTIPTRAGRAIGGLSMGGYGALRLALSRPDLFSSAHSHSGAVLAGNKRWDRPHNGLIPGEMQHVFGVRPTGTPHDLLHLAAKVPKKKLPRLHLDCGTEDFLLDDNREFHAALTDLRIPHAYAEHPGEHHWDYWDAHIQHALAWHAETLFKP